MTDAQQAILRSLYDVWAQSTDKWVTLKNRYHSTAALLAEAGIISKRDNWPYRPTYRITEEGRCKWEAVAPAEATESRTYWARQRRRHRPLPPNAVVAEIGTGEALPFDPTPRADKTLSDYRDQLEAKRKRKRR